LPAPITASVTLTSTASPFTVWLAFGDAPHWPKVLPDLIEARIEPDGKLVQGAVIHSKAKPDTGAVDMRYDVIEAEPAKRLVLASRIKGLHARTQYTFEGDVSGTRLTVSSEIDATSLLGRIAVALWRARFAKQMAAAIEMRTRALITLAERI
jgi:hypothetical protein